MNNPLVSIITPCYNGEKFIERFMDSVISQTYDNIELIIINDGSIDRTEKLINDYREKFSDRGISLIYEYQTNAGQAAALNRGLKLFSGEYMTWVDSDDELTTNYISAKIKHFSAHPDCAFCYGKIEFYIDDSPDTLVQEKTKRLNTTIEFVDCVCFNVQNICFTGYMTRRDCLKSVLRDLDIYPGKGGQNAQLLIPLAWKFGEPDYVPDSVYKSYIRSDSHSHSQNTTQKVIEQLYNYERILLETLDRINDNKIEIYKYRVRCYYARLRFGNAVDTKDGQKIKKHLHELKDTRQVKLKDYLLYLKYSNKLFFNKLLSK